MAHPEIGQLASLQEQGFPGAAKVRGTPNPRFSVGGHPVSSVPVPNVPVPSVLVSTVTVVSLWCPVPALEQGMNSGCPAHQTPNSFWEFGGKGWFCLLGALCQV